MKTIVVTGPIGAGKSKVCSIFKKKGLRVINADKVAHKVLEKQSIKKKLINSFGESIICKNGKINRVLLSDIVFKSQKKLKQLNTIVHPQLINELEIIKKRTKEKIIFFEIALFELIKNRYDIVLTILSKTENRVKRIKKRDRFLKEKIQKIIDSQTKNEVYKNNSDIVIFNDYSIKDLNLTIDIFLDNLSIIQSYKR